MKIGQFKENGSGDIIGKIRTRTIDLPCLVLRHVESRQSDRAPIYEIFEPIGRDDEIQIGTLWERDMAGGTFFSGMIDDPSLDDTLPIALFGDPLNGFDVQWRRDREPQAFGGGTYGGGNASGSRRSGNSQRQSGATPNRSTAGANGEYVGAGRGLDDEVPF